MTRKPTWSYAARGKTFAIFREGLEFTRGSLYACQTIVDRLNSWEQYEHEQEAADELRERQEQLDFLPLVGA